MAMGSEKKRLGDYIEADEDGEIAQPGKKPRGSNVCACNMCLLSTKTANSETSWGRLRVPR